MYGLRGAAERVSKDWSEIGACVAAVGGRSPMNVSTEFQRLLLGDTPGVHRSVKCRRCFFLGDDVLQGGRWNLTVASGGEAVGDDLVADLEFLSHFL